MYEPLQTALIVASFVLAAVAVVQLALDRPAGNLLLGLAALLEVGLIAQTGLGLVQLLTSDRELNGLVFAGYLIATMLFLPVATVWALGERSRGGTAVLVLGALVVPVLIVRTQQVWFA